MDINFTLKLLGLLHHLKAEYCDTAKAQPFLFMEEQRQLYIQWFATLYNSLNYS